MYATRRRHGFFNIKAKEENFREAYGVILGEQLEDWVVYSLKLGPVCAKKCKEFNEFRLQAKERHNNLLVTVNYMNCRVKRMSKTSQRERVVNRLKISIEKMKNLSLSEPTTTATSRDPPKSRKRLPLDHDHDSYTKSCCDFDHDQSGRPS